MTTSPDASPDAPYQSAQQSPNFPGPNAPAQSPQQILTLEMMAAQNIIAMAWPSDTNQGPLPQTCDDACDASPPVDGAFAPASDFVNLNGGPNSDPTADPLFSPTADPLFSYSAETQPSYPGNSADRDVAHRLRRIGAPRQSASLGVSASRIALLRAGTQLAAALPGTYFVSLRSPSVGRSDQNSADRPSEAKKQGKNKANDGGQSSRQAVISINRSGMILNSATSAVWEITAAIVAIYTVKGTATYGEQVVLSRVANAIVANIQKRIFDQMLRMKVGYYSRSHSSEFIARQAHSVRRPRRRRQGRRAANGPRIFSPARPR